MALWLWVLSGVVQAGILAFFLYWILFWGIVNGGQSLKVINVLSYPVSLSLVLPIRLSKSTLSSLLLVLSIRQAWGTNFAIDLANDILVIAIVKITWTSFLSLQTMQPQLRVIRSVFADICLTHINRASDAIDHDVEEATTSHFDERASQLRIVQHLSGACRAARSKELKNLPAAWILRQMDDVDAERCREGRAFYPGNLIFLLIAFAGCLSLMNEKVGEVVIESVINSATSGVELLGAFLASVSVLAIVLPVVLLAAVVYFLFKGTYDVHTLLSFILPCVNANPSLSFYPFV